MLRYDNGIESIFLIREVMATINPSVTMGGSGSTSFIAAVWADFLGVSKPGGTSGIKVRATPEESSDFFVETWNWRSKRSPPRQT